MFPSEGYFYLKCQKNGLVVSVNNEEKAGTKLVTDNKNDEDSQLWSFQGGCLISKHSSLVMDIDGGDLRNDAKLLQFDRKKTMAHNQRWGICDGFVYAVADPRLVLVAEDDASHIKVGVKSNENELQQWYLEPYYQAEQEE
ncbi:hypothetical protein MFLAVUS_001005 [Mucor flavus]|uniref:Ricin B lectin domain-containing protein n=1 Tax=Mucor flavus TaxID=439312 RepID=A0ABP9YLA9_9FUNG